MPQDDEQKGIVNWQDMIEARLDSDVVARIREMLEQSAALPISTIFSTATQRAAQFERQRYTYTLQPMPRRPAPVQKVMDKYQTLHTHFMRGLISSDDIGGLLDDCGRELVEVITLHKDEYKKYAEPFEDEGIVWGHGWRYSYGYGSEHRMPSWIYPGSV